MESPARRTTLKLALLGLAALAQGCSGGKDASTQNEQPDQPGPPPPPAPWNPGPLIFVAGGGDAIDLTGTLPSHIRRGGVFSIAPGSAALPAGMTLESNGTLRVGSAPIGAEADVTFAYQEP